MKLREITPADADAFESFITQRFRARVVRKSMAIEMQVVGALFDVARVLGAKLPSGHDFSQFATTIGPVIYLPDGLTPEERIIVLAHECQHVEQFWREGLGFFWLYLSEGEARVRYEAEGYAADLAVRFSLAGQLPSLDDLALPLEGGYMLSPDHVTLGRGLLEQAGTAVAAGFITTESGAESVSWLRQRGIVS